MTPEELVIEQKVQQLYASLPNWPQISQNEMDQLCKQLLKTKTVQYITRKAIRNYGKLLNQKNVEDYKAECSHCLFETLLSVLKNYDPSQGKFIPYFSRYFKLSLNHELQKELNSDEYGGMVMPTSFNGIKIDSIKRFLDQDHKKRNAPMSKEETAAFLKTHFLLSDNQISYLLNPPTVISLFIQNEDEEEEENILEDLHISSEQEHLIPEKKQERQETCLQLLSIVEEIVSAVRADTRERYRVIATWEVLLWFDELGLNTSGILEHSSKRFTFLHPQVLQDYRTPGKDFYTEAQQLARRGFFPTKSKVSEYKASFESACQKHPKLGELIASLTGR